MFSAWHKHRYNVARSIAIDLLRMPGLGHVLDPRLAFVAYQNAGERVLVRPAELINTRALARFGHRSGMSHFLNRDLVACDRIFAPDLCFGLHSHDMECAVGVDRPNGREGVGPLAHERGWTRWGSSTRTHEHGQDACEKNPKRIL